MGLRRWIPGVVVLLALVFGASIGGATSSPGNGKLGYAEAVSDRGALVVSIDESGQKRFASVDYQLVADVSVYSLCESGQAIAVGFPGLADTTSVTPDAQGHAAGTVYLASGHTYRLEPASRTWS